MSKMSKLSVSAPCDGFLAGRPSNTFLKAIEKVLDGFVKMGVNHRKLK